MRRSTATEGPTGSSRFASLSSTAGTLSARLSRAILLVPFA